MNSRQLSESELAAATPMHDVEQAIARVIRGKHQVIADFLTAVIAGGSILLEDLPGVGKTTLAKTFSALVDLEFQRLQCTPDLLPSDVLGFSIFNAKDGSFDFRPGPIFTNVLLVDEINRASPRTQSALLEAMAERQVTTEGTSRPLSDPFFVIATQNPVGFQGTYPLPEAQLDRFLFLLNMDYPDYDSEVELLYDQNNSTAQVQPVLGKAELLAMQRQSQEVEVHRDLAEYVIRIIRATRESERLQLGASPRAAQMMFRAAQAVALLAGRNYVLPDDVQHIAPLTLAHRVVATRTTRGSHQSKRQLINDLVASIEIPA